MPELGTIDYREIPRKLKLEYRYPSNARAHKLLEQTGGLLTHFQRPRMDLQELLTDAANLIAKQFSLKPVCIAMKGDDGIYRYRVLVDCKPQIETAMRELAYTYRQVIDDTVYKGYVISKYTKIYLAEDNPWPESEKGTYELPALIGMVRKSLDDLVEGDYTNVFILGKNDENLGWIEFNGTTTRKLPDVSSLQWIEFIGQIIATAVAFRPQGGK